MLISLGFFLSFPKTSEEKKSLSLRHRLKFKLEGYSYFSAVYIETGFSERHFPVFFYSLTGLGGGGLHIDVWVFLCFMPYSWHHRVSFCLYMCIMKKISSYFSRWKEKAVGNQSL